jgi:hypothetical protein
MPGTQRTIGSLNHEWPNLQVNSGHSGFFGSDLAPESLSLDPKITIISTEGVSTEA